MSVDHKIEEAIARAVSDERQSDALARRLTAWLTSVIEGRTELNDDQATYRRLEQIFDDIATTNDRMEF